MSERHTVDFDRVSFNVISDAERETITLQFENVLSGHAHIQQILKAIERRYGVGLFGRLRRWIVGTESALILRSHGRLHPENPDVLCLELGVRRGERMESALGNLIEFLRQQPGYQRMFGSPLDRDLMPSRVRTPPSGDSSKAAADTFKRMLERRK
jgi:hypothetical protein